MDQRSIGEELAGWGKVALIETVGRVSGAPASAAVGFFEDDDGSLLIAAGSEAADWALNLGANPACRVTIGERVTPCHANEVEDADRARALAQLVLKYGTPAERLGHGPVFRLTAQPEIAGGFGARRLSPRQRLDSTGSRGGRDRATRAR